MKVPRWFVVLAAAGVLVSGLIAVPTLSAAGQVTKLKCVMRGAHETYNNDGSLSLALKGSVKGRTCSATMTGVWKEGAPTRGMRLKVGKYMPATPPDGAFHAAFGSPLFAGTITASGTSPTGNPTDIFNVPFDPGPYCFWAYSWYANPHVWLVCNNLDVLVNASTQ